MAVYKFKVYTIKKQENHLNRQSREDAMFAKRSFALLHAFATLRLNIRLGKS